MKMMTMTMKMKNMILLIIIINGGMILPFGLIDLQ